MFSIKAIFKPDYEEEPMTKAANSTSGCGFMTHLPQWESNAAGRAYVSYAKAI